MGIAGAIVGAAVIGGVGSAVASHSAANSQKNAAAQANATQTAQYAQTRNDLNPYNTAGQGALNALTNGLGTSNNGYGQQSGYGQQGIYGGNQGPNFGQGQNGQNGQFGQYGGQYGIQGFDGGRFGGQNEGGYVPNTQAAYQGNQQGGQPSNGGMPNGYLTQPFNMTQSQLEQAPGYQFNLSQGLKSVDNALGARGLLNSGAVIRGGAEYATGLADSTYQNQFNNDQIQKTNIYNRLIGTAALGENAAAQTGALGTQTATQIGQNTIGAGNASAAAAIATGNAFSGIANSIPSALLTNRLLSQNAFGGIYGSSGGFQAGRYGN